MTKKTMPDRGFQKELEMLRQKYGLSYKELENAIKEHREKTVIPVSVFKNDKLSPLETIVKHLKENKGLRFSEIGGLTGRDPRVICTTYRRAKIKMPEELIAHKSRFEFPVYLLKDKKLSVFEHITRHLKDDHDLRLREIAILMNRDDRTIWTIYNRLKLKINGNV